MPSIKQVVATMAASARIRARRRRQDRANTPSALKAAMIAAQRARDFPQDEPYG